MKKALHLTATLATLAALALAPAGCNRDDTDVGVGGGPETSAGGGVNRDDGTARDTDTFGTTRETGTEAPAPATTDQTGTNLPGSTMGTDASSPAAAPAPTDTDADAGAASGVSGTTNQETGTNTGVGTATSPAPADGR